MRILLNCLTGNGSIARLSEYQWNISKGYGWYQTIPHHIETLRVAVTLQYTQWCLKSPASRLFAQPFVQAPIRENIKAPRHWPLWGEFTSDRWIPLTQRASYAETVSIWWSHHGKSWVAWNTLLMIINVILQHRQLSLSMIYSIYLSNGIGRFGYCMQYYIWFKLSCW